MIRRHATAALATIALAWCAHGQSPTLDPPASDDADGPWRLTFHWDNDGTVIKPNHNTDRHYTNGARITFDYQPQWADDIARDWFKIAPDEHGDLATAGGFVIGQNMYTPDRVGNPALRDPEDRPFAGWLYLGAYWQHQHGNMLDQLELDVGVLGPSSQADSIQRWIHDVFDEPNPRGWSSQIGDEGGFNLSFNRQWRHDLLTQTDEHPAVQFIPRAGFTLGTIFRHAGFGAMIRVGQNLPDDFGSAQIDLPASALNLREPGFSWYIFARGGARVVAENRFLSGVDPEPLVGDAEFGLVLRWQEFSLKYSQTFLSNRFKTQDGHDDYGSLVLSFTHTF